MDNIEAAMADKVTQRECEATSGGIEKLLDAHKADIVMEVRANNGRNDAQQMRTELTALLKKGLALVGSCLAIIMYLLHQFLGR